MSLWSLYVPFSPARPLFGSVTLPYWFLLSCPEKDNLNLCLVLSYLISLILISLCCCLVVLLLMGCRQVLYADKFSDKRLDFAQGDGGGVLHHNEKIIPFFLAPVSDSTI